MRKTTKRGGKIVSNIFYFSLQQVSLVVFGYLFYVILGRMLSPGQYGIMFTILSLFSIISIFSTFGFNESLLKLVPEMIKKKEKEKAFSLIKFSIKFSFVFSLLLSLFIFFFSNELSSLLYGSSEMTIPFQYLSSLILFGTMMLMLKGILHSLQKFKESFFGDLVGNVLKIVVAVALVFIGFQAVGGMIALLSWFVASSIIFSIFFLRVKIGSAVNFAKKRVFSYSFLSLLSISSVYTLQQGGIIILSMLSTLEASAFFAVTFVFGQFVIFIPSSFLGSALPSLSELWLKEKKVFRNLLMIITKMSIIITLPVTIFFIIFSNFLIETIYTPEYLGAAVLFPSYLLGSFLLGMSLIFSISLYSANRPHIRAAIMLSGALLNLVLLLILIPLFNLQGAAFAFLTAQVLIFLLSLFFLSKTVDMSFSKKSMLIIPLNLIFLVILGSSSYFNDVLIKMFILIIGILVYFCLLFVMGIINKNDLIILEYLPDSFYGRLIKKMLSKFVR